MPSYTRGMKPACDTHATAKRDGMLVGAAVLTWAAVASTSVDFERLTAAEPRETWGAACVLAFVALFLAPLALAPGLRRERMEAVVAVGTGLLVVIANLLMLEGMLSVLLVIVAAHFAQLWSPRKALAGLVILNLAFAAPWLAHLPWTQVLLMLLPVFGFQAFAALTMHYAASAERGREQLAHAHAELLATQALLAEGARSGERLKLSRELHDVAGHKLTALKLHLARLRRDPALARREEVGIAGVLADELLDDIRGVVGELRNAEGIDLRTALFALATAFPPGQVVVHVPDDLRLDDLAQAEALVRCAQEAITNALRHGRAHRIEVRVARTQAGVTLQVANDGARPGDLRPGHGLIGMRERLEALGGTLGFDTTGPRGLVVHATLPSAAA